MENKKTYETPEVIKVEYDAADRITASGVIGPTFGGTDPGTCSR